MTALLCDYLFGTHRIYEDIQQYSDGTNKLLSNFRFVEQEGERGKLKLRE